MSRARSALVVVAAIQVGASCATSPKPFDCAAPPQSLRGLVRVKNPVPGRYIVVLKRTSAEARSVAAVKRFAERLAGLRGVAAFREVLSGFSAGMDESAARKLAASPEVAFVQEHGGKSVGPRLAPEASVTWGLDRSDQRDLALDGRYEPGATGGLGTALRADPRGRRARPARPPVDFSRDMLVAVATGTRPSGGFDIQVQGVTRRGGVSR